MNKGIFIASHLAVLGGAWLVAGKIISAGSDSERDSHSPSQSDRTAASQRDSASMARSFVIDANSKPDRSAHLKTLAPMNEGHLEKLEELMMLVPKSYLVVNGPYLWDNEDIALFEARLLEWLITDRAACAAWLKSKRNAPFSPNHPIFMEVLADFATNRSFDEGLTWMENISIPAITTVLENRMKTLGLSAFLERHAAEFKTDHVYQIMRAVPFKDRELLIPHLTERFSSTPWRIRQALESFLENPKHPREETFHWLKALQKSDTLPESMRSNFNRTFNEWLKKATFVPIEERAAIIHELGFAKEGYYHEKTTAEGLIYRMGSSDIRALLRDGRDWRYEYGQGRVDGEEVWENLRKELPGMTAESEKGARFGLFQHLAEHDYNRAASLLNVFPEEERRKLIHGTTSYAFINVNPARLLDFIQSAPPPETEAENAYLNKGWDWRARFFINRHGDDYVDWVQTIPEGTSRDEAVESVMWSTGELNKSREIELRRSFLKKPSNSGKETE